MYFNESTFRDKTKQGVIYYWQLDYLNADKELQLRVEAFDVNVAVGSLFADVCTRTRG